MDEGDLRLDPREGLGDEAGDAVERPVPDDDVLGVDEVVQRSAACSFTRPERYGFVRSFCISPLNFARRAATTMAAFSASLFTRSA